MSGAGEPMALWGAGDWAVFALWILLAAAALFALGCLTPLGEMAIA